MTSIDPTPHMERTITEYAAQIASAAPIPGGGSVAATVGALACALAEMVCNVTLNGKSVPEDPEPLRRAAVKGAEIRDRLLKLSAEDEAAYGGYQSAVALPRTNDAELLIRREALNRALEESTRVPLEIARAGLEVLKQLQVTAELGTKHALSDVTTGAVLAKASIRSALFTAQVNVVMTRDQNARSRYESEIASLHERATSDTNDILNSVDNRTFSG